MKKNVFVVVCLMFVMMFVGCVKKSNNEEKLTNIITELVNYEKSKNVKSVNSEEVLSARKMALELLPFAPVKAQSSFETSGYG